jgi:hypothetical protein
MREYAVVFREGLAKGLRPSPQNARNNEFLYSAKGCIPEDGVLQSLPILYNTFTLPEQCKFPFPQIFVLRRLVLVCSETNIYELRSFGTELLYPSAPAGATWSVADFGEYVLLTNGRVLIYRNAQTGQFLEYVDCEIPSGICVLNLNGQLIIGAPGEVVGAGFTGE